MKMIRALLTAAFCSAFASSALAQSNPGLKTGQVPTAAQWNSYFSAKQDFNSIRATSPIEVSMSNNIVTISCPTCGSGGVSFTTGSVPFGSGTGALTQSNAAFFWDNSQKMLRLSRNATSSPTPTTDAVNYLVGIDSAVNRLLMDSFASFNALTFRRDSGTRAGGPSALIANQVIGAITWRGMDSDGNYSTVNSALVSGVAAGTWSGTSHPAYLTLSTTPVGSILAATQRMFIADDGGVNFGTSIASPGAGAVNIETGPGSQLYFRINANANPPAAQTSPQSIIHIIGADVSQSTPVQFDTFGGALSMIFRRANGTGAAPTALTTSQPIMNLTSRGYDGSAYSDAGTGTAMEARTTQDWCATCVAGAGAHGTGFMWRIVRNNTTTTYDVAWLGQGLTVGNTQVDPGEGVINAATGFRVANAATSGRVLRGNGTNFVSASLVASDITGLNGDTMVGNWTSIGGGLGINNPMPSCPDTGSNHLNYVTGTGITCGTSASRPVLTATRTYFVRTDGSDSNTGLVDSAGGAFLTWQKCQTTVAALDNGGFAVNCQQGTASGQAGVKTYTGGVSCTAPYIGSGTVTFTGDTTTPSNVLMSTTTAPAFTVTNGCIMTIGGFKTNPTTAFGITATDAGIFYVTGLMEYSCVASGCNCAINGSRGANLQITANFTISGTKLVCGIRMFQNAALLLNAGRTITLSGTPEFTSGFYNCSMAGTLIFGGASPPTLTGTGIGTRFIASQFCGAFNSIQFAFTGLTAGTQDGSNNIQ